MKRNPRLDVKIKVAPKGGRPRWLHVEWFKVGGSKPRKYVDRCWLAEDESEATPVEPSRAKALACDARELAASGGLGRAKAVYMAKAGRGWAPTTLKAALAAEGAYRAKLIAEALHN